MAVAPRTRRSAKYEGARWRRRSGRRRCRKTEWELKEERDAVVCDRDQRGSGHVATSLPLVSDLHRLINSRYYDGDGNPSVTTEPAAAEPLVRVDGRDHDAVNDHLRALARLPCLVTRRETHANAVVNASMVDKGHGYEDTRARPIGVVRGCCGGERRDRRRAPAKAEALAAGAASHEELE